MKKIVFLICGFVFAMGLIFLVTERNRYNIVSNEELFIIRQKLNNLSSQEKRDFAFFIKQAISFDYYPYTLIGYKPMSISPVIIEATEDLSPHFRNALKNPNHQKLRQGYLVWEKYQSLFPRKKNIVIEYSFLGKGRKEIALISPKSCMSVIQEHLEDFQEILRKPYKNEEVFEILTHPEHSEFHKIIDSTCLVGILLGYGRDNARLYEQYRGGPSRSAIAWNQRPEQDPLQFFSSEWPLPGRLLSPNFACDPFSEETQRLRTHYSRARKTIRWTYFLRNKLEVTLALLEQN